MKANFLKMNRTQWLQAKRKTKRKKAYQVKRENVTLERKEFTRLKDTWRQTLANLDHHLINDKF